MFPYLLQMGFSFGNVPSVGSEGAVEGFFKLIFVLLAFMYLIFAFVVTRQIKTMRTTVMTTFSPVVRLLGYVHFVIAVVVFIFFMLFL